MALQHSIIKYPCDFPIKIIGQDNQHLTDTILTIVKSHFPSFDTTSLEKRKSKQSKYLSLTCTIRATSRPQLDALYQELYDHPMVVMVL